MTPIVPRIAVFSLQKESTFVTSDSYRWLAKGFEIHFFNTPNIKSAVSLGRFSVAVFLGPKIIWNKVNTGQTPKLFLEKLDGDAVYNFYIDEVIKDKSPVVSIFTPAHKTFEKFVRCYNSVVNQSFSNWEWIILDDSVDTDNFNYISKIVSQDSRIKVYRPNRNDSFVGSTKRQAASLCSGDYLLELDHDDELHHLALEYIVSAFNKFPDAGFCYSNCAEVYEDGGSVVYGKGFGMNYGIHFNTNYKGKDIVGSDVPINASTIRHIVGVPNHLRCWKRDIYFDLERHNSKLAVVDDYELLVRTFLYTKMIHIKDVLYIQYMNRGGNNTQEPRRAEIQRLVDRIYKKYDTLIHERLLELCGSDWLWNNTINGSDMNLNVKRERVNLAYVY